MPIKQPIPVATQWDLARARQIARAWTPLNQLSPAVAEIVARAIAQGIAEGRSHGMEMAKASSRPCCPSAVLSISKLKLAVRARTGITESIER